MRCRLLAAGAVLAVVGAGCGLSTSDSPETLSREVLPEDLGGPPESSQLDELEGGTSVHLWFVSESEDGTGLVSVADHVPAGPSSPTPQVLLEALLNYDPDELEDEGYFSAIPADTGIREVRLSDDGELTVDMPETFYENPDAGEGRYAFGQVVRTVTRLPGVDSVLFLQDGEAVPVTDGEGEDRNGPVTAADYDSIILD